MVTDWGEINNQVGFHKTAYSESEAALLATTETTIDMSMVPSSTAFGTDMRAHVAHGKVSQTHIDAAAGRVLQLKKNLGLLDDPHLDAAASLIPTVGQQSDRDDATDIARESLTLLRNDDATDGLPTLPLRPNAKVLLTGPAADSRRLLCGGWTLHWQGPVDDSVTEFPHQQQTVAEAFTQLHTAQGGEVVVESGMTLVHGKWEFAGDPDGGDGNCDGKCATDRAAALTAAADPTVDVIVLVFGEEVYTEKPGDIDDSDLPLPLRQYALDLIATGKPVVAVLVEGRPRLLRGSIDDATAVVWAGLPGPEGGVAIAELLTGANDFNPSGRLPITYPSSNVGNTYYFHKNSHQCNNQGDRAPGPHGHVLSGAVDMVLDRFPHWGNGPSVQQGGCYSEWDFGDGLSYTTFEYSNLQLSKTLLAMQDDDVTVTVTVTNSGAKAGKHTVMLFLTDEYRIITPEVKML